MITDEHLNQWLTEIKYHLVSIEKEIEPDKVKLKGINVEEAFVSFEYLQEKAMTLAGLVRCIEDDMKND